MEKAIGCIITVFLGIYIIVYVLKTLIAFLFGLF